MIDLGSELRAAREAKGNSLNEAQKATHIKERYLQALEKNDWAALPTAVQARGFLRNYATYLGLDVDEVMSKFAQTTRSASVSLPASPVIDTPVRTTQADGAVFHPRDIAIDRIQGMPAWLSSDVLIGIALALIVALVGFAVLSLASGDGKEPGVLTTATSQTDARQATPLPGAATEGAPASPSAATGTESTPGVTPTFNAGTGSVELALEATERVWVRVTVDGEPVLEGILAPGAGQRWQGSQQVMLETGNGAALQAVVNGQPQGSLGSRGEVVVLAWGPGGQLVLTPTAQP